MARRRKRTSASPPTVVATPASAPDTPVNAVWIHLFAAVAVMLCLVLGWLARHALNPDGVSYLDLASLGARGDWRAFAQDYWSPLLPALLAAFAVITGRTGPELVAPAHWLNVIAALAAIAIVWRWSLRRLPGPFGLAAIPALMLSSAGMPRIEAVTPDVVLLLLITWIGYELVVHGGRRSAAIGTALGLAFLAKTSCWPWLLVAVAVRWIAAPDRPQRRRVIASSAIAAVLMAAWVVPTSLVAHHFSMGTAARLNYSWYIDGSTSRLPDSDLGDHRAYQHIGGQGVDIVVARFDRSDLWTYQPWGDPTAWSAGVTEDTGHTPAIDEVISYWLRSAGNVVAIWLLPVLAGVLAPMVIAWRRRGGWRELLDPHRDAAIAIALGVIGVLQFVAVHAEPRLIAPFGALLALGSLDWLTASGATPRWKGIRLRWLLVAIPAATMTGYAAFKLSEGIRSRARLDAVIADLAVTRARLEAIHALPLPIGVIGPAAPVMSAAFWIGARIAVQIPPQSAKRLATLPMATQTAVVRSAFGDRVALIWRSSADGNVTVVAVPR